MSRLFVKLFIWTIKKYNFDVILILKKNCCREKSIRKVYVLAKELCQPVLLSAITNKRHWLF